jgi:hypothetical protein
MDLYLTSQDWANFVGSQQIQSIERIKKGIFSYFLVTLIEPIIHKNTKQQQLLLTSTFHFVRHNYKSRLPLEFDVYSVEHDKKNKITCGEILGKGIYLHKKDQ